MFVNTKEMTGVPVETRSGRAVGKVASFELDAATGRLVHLCVKSRGLMSGALLISWDAIIELSPEKVIVADTAVPVGAESLVQTKPPAPAPTLMKER
ncbi:PRC-barrel domain containing protein [Candidatus Uhrbacteria bacterium]|nr:PRC-barrel domain containing protein [Candidatus Uhrbacteria bacterium]